MRKRSIGSSDAAVILGLDPYRTPYDLWLEKTGRVDGFEGNKATERGDFLEAGILRWAASKLGQKVFAPKGPFVYGVLRAHVDGLVGKAVKGSDIVEAKNMVGNDDWGTEGTNEIPMRVYIQVQHQMICAESTLAHVARLSGGAGMCFSLYRVEPDPEVQSKIIEQSEAFWEAYIKTDIAPPFTRATDTTVGYMSNIERTGDEIRLDDDQMRLYFECKAEIAELEGRMRLHKANILNKLGDSSCGIGAEYKAKMITVRGSRKFHLKTLKEQFPEQHEACKIESTGFSYLKVTRKG